MNGIKTEVAKLSNDVAELQYTVSKLSETVTELSGDLEFAKKKILFLENKTNNEKLFVKYRMTLGLVYEKSDDNMRKRGDLSEDYYTLSNKLKDINLYVHETYLQGSLFEYKKLIEQRLKNNKYHLIQKDIEDMFLELWKIDFMDNETRNLLRNMNEKIMTELKLLSK